MAVAKGDAIYICIYIYIYREYSTGKPKLFILITKLKFSTRHTTKKFSRFYPEKFRAPCGSSKTEWNGMGMVEERGNW